jgi:hypothetical protein
MLRSWATLASNTGMRLALVTIGILATIALGPISAFGLYMLVTAPFSDAADRYQSFGWWVLGGAAMVSLVGAWMRVLIRPEGFRSSAFLRWLTCVLLVPGIAAAVLIVAAAVRGQESVLVFIAIPSLATAIFLFGATLGETGDAP